MRALKEFEGLVESIKRI